MKRCFFILQLILSGVMLCQAQSLVVNVPSNVSTGENFRLTYTVSTRNASDFHIGNVPDALEVITGPYVSEQSSYQMANGHTSSSSSKTYTFILCATKNGTYTIPSASVVVNGKRLKSKTAKIKVSGNNHNGNGAPRMHEGANDQPRMREAGTPIQPFF